MPHFWPFHLSSPPPTLVVSPSTHLGILLLLLAGWCYRSSHIHPSVWVFGLLLCWFQDLYKDKIYECKLIGFKKLKCEPGRNTTKSRPHSSSHQHYQTLRSNLALKTTSLDVSLRRIRIHLRQPDKSSRLIISRHKQLTKIQHKSSDIYNWEVIHQHTWCARQIKSISCFCRNLDTTSGPNVKDTPRSFSDQPVMSLSGSDHSRSQSNPKHTYQYKSMTTMKGRTHLYREHLLAAWLCVFAPSTVDPDWALHASWKFFRQW